MTSNSPLLLSRGLLTTMGVRPTLYFQERIPSTGAVLVVSNHRSFLDAPLLIASLNRPVRFACHHYMLQVPILRQIVKTLGCLPLDPSALQQRQFFQQATTLLQAQEAVGVFPEGGAPMLKPLPPPAIYGFQRGFAHLAIQAAVPELVILPIAIAPLEELSGLAFPLRLLQQFDPAEPLFSEADWHPLLIYRRVSVLVGRPIHLTQELRQHHQGRRTKQLSLMLAQACQEEIANLLSAGREAWQ